jgi:hypothetical protein
MNLDPLLQLAMTLPEGNGYALENGSIVLSGTAKTCLEISVFAKTTSDYET